MGMFDGTSLRRSGFAPPINAAHAAFTVLFCIRRVHKFRKLEVKVRSEGLRVWARRGYCAPGIAETTGPENK
jgi:hypothetical protein